MNELTEAEKHLIGFALACYLEDTEIRLKKLKRQGNDVNGALFQLKTIERITYTKIIPNSWSGPKPKEWNISNEAEGLEAFPSEKE